MQDKYMLKLIHGDLKPNNVLLQVDGNKLQNMSDGKTALAITDFGTSKEMTENVRYISGTPGFVSPEQTAAKSCDKSDNYNVGIMLTMLCMEWKSCWTAFLKPFERHEDAKSAFRKIVKESKFAAKILKIIYSLISVAILNHDYY